MSPELSPVHQVQNRQQQERLVRGLALGGTGPGWAGGAAQGGELFDRGGEVGHWFFILLFQKAALTHFSRNLLQSLHLQTNV